MAIHKSTMSSFGSIKARPPLAFPGQRIGLLGGSFNPPHEGHRLITEIALRRLQLDALWWLVTPGNPLKDPSLLPPLEERLCACREFIQNPRVHITGFERHLPTPYTAATLAYLKLRRRGTKFVWVMGADNLALVHHWQNWRDIFQQMPVAVVDRPGWHLPALSSPAAQAFLSNRLPQSRAALLVDQPLPAFSFLTGPLSAQSSTEIRDHSNT